LSNRARKQALSPNSVPMGVINNFSCWFQNGGHNRDREILMREGSSLTVRVPCQKYCATPNAAWKQKSNLSRSGRELQALRAGVIFSCSRRAVSAAFPLELSPLRPQNSACNFFAVKRSRRRRLSWLAALHYPPLSKTSPNPPCEIRGGSKRCATTRTSGPRNSTFQGAFCQAGFRDEYQFAARQLHPGQRNWGAEWQSSARANKQNQLPLPQRRRGTLISKHACPIPSGNA